MGFSTSVNIERDFGKTPDYIVTANARQAVGKIINQYNAGIHSFCLIGSYGTGKSSFILALENCLRHVTTGAGVLLKDPRQFDGYDKFSFLNIVGDYAALSSVLSPAIKAEEKNCLSAFDAYYNKIHSKGAFLVVVIDEFGKILEHAAKNNPEKEMYFLQKFCELVNDTSKNVLFIATLHQGFNAYAKGLKESQKQEWTKVKGRIFDIVFNEPIEQLLNLTDSRLSANKVGAENGSVSRIYDLALRSKFASRNLNTEVAAALYPLDVIAAYVLTQANQRYGQNERTLFTFLESTGDGSIADFKARKNYLYNLAEVYDYITYSFYSRLQEINEDSANWSAVKIAIERTEGLNESDSFIEDAIKIIKAVGLMSIFSSSAAVLDKEILSEYSRYSMGIENPEKIIERLEKSQILRYAKYKSKYILFEGTDVDIEAGLFEAARECKKPEVVAERISSYFDFKIALANAHYFRTGTPRYFQYLLTSEAVEKVPAGEIDGYINLLFAPKESITSTIEHCQKITGQAIVYCIFKNTEEIAEYLFEIEKLSWVRDYYVADENDKVALKEIANLISHEQDKLNRVVIDSLFTDCVEWYFNGERIETLHSQKDLTRLISSVCDVIYYGTPVYRFELINKHRPTGNMSVARQLFLQAILEHSTEVDCGMEQDKFPPEKSLYLTLVKNTGIHTECGLGAPSDPTFEHLWNACDDFFKSTYEKQRRLSELTSILASAPFRLKQGFIDCWLPTLLIIRKEDFALYSDGQYIPYINKEVIDLILRTPSNYTVKAFDVDGVKRGFFDKYRAAINLSASDLTSGSFIETIRPFLTFYRKLNNYAKKTRDISVNARKFRDVIANATDPEKTFFETLPEELGFKEIIISQNPEAIESFVEVIHGAIKDLRSCYDELISSVEKVILTATHLDGDFSEYHKVIADRYSKVNSSLMPLNMKTFHARLTGKYDSKKLWIEAVSYVVLNKPLTELKDADKPHLMRTIQDMLFQLDDYVEMHKSGDDSVIRLHITQNRSKEITTQVVVSPEMEKDVNALEEKLEAMLSADESINTAALINLLKKKLK